MRETQNLFVQHRSNPKLYNTFEIQQIPSYGLLSSSSFFNSGRHCLRLYIQILTSGSRATSWCTHTFIPIGLQCRQTTTTTTLDIRQLGGHGQASRQQKRNELLKARPLTRPLGCEVLCTSGRSVIVQWGLWYIGLRSPSTW